MPDLVNTTPRIVVIGVGGAGGNAVTNLAQWNGTSWSSLGSGFTSSGIPGDEALAVSDGNLYVGGSFTTAGGQPANSIAKWDGRSWSALGSGLDNIPDALAVVGNVLYAGGTFTTAGGKVSPYVAEALIASPANAVSTFLDSGDFVVHFDGTPGTAYTIESASDFSSSWQKVTNIVAPITDQGFGPGVFEFRDATTPSAQRFYRAVYPAY